MMKYFTRHTLMTVGGNLSRVNQSKEVGKTWLGSFPLVQTSLNVQTPLFPHQITYFLAIKNSKRISGRRARLVWCQLYSFEHMQSSRLMLTETQICAADWSDWTESLSSSLWFNCFSDSHLVEPQLNTAVSVPRHNTLLLLFFSSFF